jgi:transcription-repair coupling factor (superfamily II helicase)
LARQHLETFRKRFAGFGLRIGSLSRLSPPAEAKETKRALAAGEVRIAIGTHALAAKGVRFQDLGLVVIDEEQRFGTRQKASLREMGQGVHVLTLTATPIPRTLQAALVGLQSLSVIATPPARRQPIRTARAPLDDALLTQALRREARRGGQSFVVCPRIEDIEPMRERIAGLLPDLSLLVAHGGMPPAEVDEALVRFAAGGRGRAALHQHRGNRARRAARQHHAGLAPRPLRPVAAPPAPRAGGARAGARRDLPADRPGRPAHARHGPAAPHLGGAGPRRRRLRHQRPRPRPARRRRPAGRAAGRAPAPGGIELYRHMLDRALAAARGEPPPEQWTPHLGLNLDAFIPPEHVPEEALRVELHARWAS